MENLNKPKKKFKSPNAFIILISITIICTIMTWIIPAGEFQKETVESLGREIIIPGSYTQIPSTPVTPWGMVQSIYDGFVEAADIIFFVLMAAAYVHVLMETGALNALAGFFADIGRPRLSHHSGVYDTVRIGRNDLRNV